MNTFSIAASLFAFATLAPFAASAQHHSEHSLQIPSSLKTEHHELHNKLKDVIAIGGKTGRAAEAVAKALHHHFEAEEEFAMPQLGLLRAAAGGEYPAGSDEAITLSRELREKLPTMLEERKAIVCKLDELVNAAKLEKKNMALEFAEALRLHAISEEEVLYPAAILVGDQLARNRN
jgi:hypothetical protein